MEFDTKYRAVNLPPSPLPSLHCAIAKLENDDELYIVPSFNRVREISTDEKLEPSWSINLCRIGEFHQPRFLLSADWMLRFTATISFASKRTGDFLKNDLHEVKMYSTVAKHRAKFWMVDKKRRKNIRVKKKKRKDPPFAKFNLISLH